MDVLELVQRNFNPSEEDNLSKRSAVCHKPHSDPFTHYLANFFTVLCPPCKMRGRAMVEVRQCWICSGCQQEAD